METISNIKLFKLCKAPASLCFDNEKGKTIKPSDYLITRESDSVFYLYRKIEGDELNHYTKEHLFEHNNSYFLYLLWFPSESQAKNAIESYWNSFRMLKYYN